LRIKIDCKPMGAVRMTQRGKWVNKSAQRYLAYKDDVAWQIKSQFNREPIDSPVRVIITFFMPIPKSWTKKRKAQAPGTSHVYTPDIDNLVKGAFDAANGILWEDDKIVSELDARKVYSEEPGISIVLREVE